MKRTTDFVMSAVDSTPDTPVLFVEVAPDEIVTEPFLTLARLEDIERLKREVRESTLDEVQEFVVAHAYDTTVGRRIDDFITALLDANKG